MHFLQRKETFDPFEALRDFQTDLDRFISGGSATPSKGWQRSVDPDIEVTEKDNEYLVHADLPGMKREDFDISVEGNRFILRGERKEEQKTEKKGYHYSERRYGGFARVFTLPVEIDTEKVRASYKNGVLEVSLPKSAKEKPKKIDVTIDA